MYGIGTRPVRATDLALSFGPLVILLAVALIASSAVPDVTYARTQWTVRLAIAFAAPAFVAFILTFGRAPLGALWRLWWTCAFLAFAIHLAFAFFGMHAGDINSVLQTMGRFGFALAASVITLWMLDILLAWTIPASTSLTVSLIRALAAFAVFGAMLHATFTRTGMIVWFGVVLLVIVAGAVLVRLFTANRQSLA